MHTKTGEYLTANYAAWRVVVRANDKTASQDLSTPPPRKMHHQHTNLEEKT